MLLPEKLQARSIWLTVDPPRVTDIIPPPTTIMVNTRVWSQPANFTNANITAGTREPEKMKFEHISHLP